MKTLGFFFSKLAFGSNLVIRDGWVIVILISCLNFLGYANRISLQRDSFRENAKRSGEIWGWLIGWRWCYQTVFELFEHCFPVAMAIGVFTVEPSDKVPVDNVEAEKDASALNG